MDEQATMRIGEAARVTDVSTGMLRHYEARGLVTPARDARGDRIYGFQDVVRIELIRSLSLGGLSLIAIAAMLTTGDAAVVPVAPVPADLADPQQAMAAVAVDLLRVLR